MLILLKYTIEIGEIIKSTLKTHFSYRQVRVKQQTRGMFQANCYQIVRKGLSCGMPEETTKRHRSHPHHIRQGRQTNFLHIVFFHIILYFIDTQRIDDMAHTGKRIARQDACLLIQRKLMKNGHETQHSIKTTLFTDQGIKHRIYFLHALFRKSQPTLCLLQHGKNGLKMSLMHKRTSKQVC